ncbi:hydrogenase maturation protease [Caballeronia sordidicola]|uniref:Ni,Fe-hydrogenase maturation factor, HoxW n=1 Tax=Caballeronia sordidicola TaxID=196367 RepID=A0A226X3G2_CABSO|nr:hydrogenase maturation protease [Caballeronia sordidicola]OXC77974.1 Ni,Fe-hydrogenase maturation factor, HoxW [Caballeronia sordidicola]
MTAPLLVFGWGNLSRGDDALGPLFVQQLSALAGLASGHRVDFLEDYQLQIEHALDLVCRERVLFVDTSLNCAAPFEVTTLSPARDASFTTHAMSAQSVMQVYCDLYGVHPPPCTLLAIRGMQFELGEPPAPVALENLARALVWGRSWMLDKAALPAIVPEAMDA